MSAFAAKFHNSDHFSTLFPLQTNKLVINHHGDEISKFVYEQVLNKDSTEGFLPQQRVYADKPRQHLRRTVKLDPVAEFFIYDFTYRCREIFRKPVSDARLSFGYRFVGGDPVSIGSAYRDFRKAVRESRLKYKYHLKFDIASYFNSLYHHDLAHWVASKAQVSDSDKEFFGQWLREINAGRSVDCLPHGIYPAKMVGSEFLKFLEVSGEIKCAQTIRFMDDVHLFDDQELVLKADFLRMQQLLGEYSLNVNPAKTGTEVQGGSISEQASEIKKSLLEIVEVEDYVETASGVEVVTEEIELSTALSEGQVQQLVSFLKNDELEEADAEFIIGTLRDHSKSLLEHVPLLLDRFPSLYKSIYFSTLEIDDPEGYSSIILDFLKKSAELSEFQLFWLAVIAEEVLSKTSVFGEILLQIYAKTSVCKIARAKVLEIPVQDFGFKEIRRDLLKTGSSDWISWSAAIGSRTLAPAERNYGLNYFAKGSSMNFLISSAVQKM